MGKMIIDVEREKQPFPSPIPNRKGDDRFGER